MKAILINPFTRSVSEVECSGDIQEIYDMLNCGTFTVATFYNPSGDGVFVDDEGMLADPAGMGFFYLPELYPQPLAGMGLVLGCDEDGNSTAPVTPLEEIAGLVEFYTHAEVYERIRHTGRM